MDKACQWRGIDARTHLHQLFLKLVNLRYARALREGFGLECVCVCVCVRACFADPPANMGRLGGECVKGEGSGGC